MISNTQKRFTTITAIVAVVSLLIAVIIGIATGAFRNMATRGGLRINEPDRAFDVAVDERKSLPLTNINRIVIKVVSENITIRETSGNDITAWFHGSVSSALPGDMPRLEVSQQGDTAEIRIERKQHTPFGWTSNDTVLEVGIPKQYTGKLSVKGVSADITVGSHDYTELALKTVSGNIEADAVTGDVDAHSVSGGVALTFTKMPGSIAVETVSGDIRLGMPANTGFKLDAHSVSGSVTCDFPITLTNSQGGGGHNLAGTVGSGKGAVTARTVSGKIGITRN